MFIFSWKILSKLYTIVFKHILIEDILAVKIVSSKTIKKDSRVVFLLISVLFS
jgi:hypothetical protein